MDVRFCEWPGSVEAIGTTFRETSFFRPSKVD